MFKYIKSRYVRQLTSGYRAMVKGDITMAHFEQSIKLITDNMEILFNSLGDMEDFEEIICKIINKKEPVDDILKEAKEYVRQNGVVVEDSKSALISKFSSMTLGYADEKKLLFKPKSGGLEESIRSLRAMFFQDKEYFKNKIKIDPDKEDQVLSLLMHKVSYILGIHVTDVSSTIIHQVLVRENPSRYGFS